MPHGWRWRWGQESFEFLYSKIDNPTLRLSDGSNFTRLISATESSNVRAVRFLSNKKVRVNDYDFEGRTALHHNFAKVPYNDNDMEIARILLNIGGDPNAEDFDDIPAHALAELPAQKALLEGVLLKQFAHDALLNRRKETAEIEDSPVVKTEPDDPGFPQLRRKPRLRM